LKKLALTWAVLRLIWESRGYNMKDMPDLLKARWPGREGLAFTSLYRKASEGKKAPRDIAAFVMDEAKLPPRMHYEEPAEVVRLGVAALLGQPTPNKEPPQLALDLLAHFPTDELAIKLADALATQAAGKGSTLGKLAQRVARLTARRLDTLLSAVGGKALSAVGKLGAVEATLNHADAKLDLLEAQLDRARREILRTVRVTGLLVVAAGGALVHCRHLPPAPAPSSVNVNIGRAGVAEQAAAGGGWDPYGTLISVISGAAGERKAGRPMPHQPLPHQAKAPCQGSATTLYGACWKGTNDPAPCPPDTYQEGQTCYIPLTADPNHPVGGQTESRGEPRPGRGAPTEGEQPRPVQAMPAKEEH
jgi:hypothetical protein